MLQLIWWLVEPEKLSTLAYAVINDPAATIFVSTATGWELATKVRLGKLPGAEGLLVEQWLVAIFMTSGARGHGHFCPSLQHTYHQHLIYCVYPFNPTSQTYSGNQP